MTRSKNCLHWVRQTVNVKNPHITSPAGLSLLSKKYFAMDKTIYTERRMSSIRNKWMKLQMKINRDKDGGLTCAICGRTGLQPFSSGKCHMAVLDHITEIVRGGSWNDSSNFQIACFECNDRKNTNLQKMLRKEWKLEDS